MIRFYFNPMVKPWYWFFTWWKRRWINYGVYTAVLPGEPRYNNAPYELGYRIGINSNEPWDVIPRKYWNQF
jgi:hypothetical protein